MTPDPQEDKISVLVVDDVPQNLEAIRAALAQPGLRLLEASSGMQALEMLLTEEVALALLDVRMPTMSGFELAELMRGRESTRNIPIIFMTAETADPTRAFRGYEAGAVDFLHKPLDPQILSSKVDIFVELHTQRRKLSRQLEELKNALRLNEMFIAVLGHDLRNPLSAISATGEVMARNTTDGTIRMMGERIRSSSGRMARMITGLLDFARLRGAGVQLERKKFDLAQLCAGIRDELVSAGKASTVGIETRGDPAAMVDADRLSQVFSNLIGNAIQHGKPGAPVTVRIDGSDAHWIGITVENEGEIPPSRAAAPFEPFLGAASPGTGGLGLGLYIASQFVEAHGGTLKLERDTPGRTVFEMRIPRAE